MKRCPNESRARVVAYLRAWRLPDWIIDELAETTVDCAERRLRDQSNCRLETVLTEEADRLLCERVQKIVGNAITPERTHICEHDKLALLWAACTEKWHSHDASPTDLRQAVGAGKEAVLLAQQPQRPPETHPMLMQTSLTRLPSFRMISGWFVLVALIVLAFIFTR